MRPLVELTGFDSEAKVNGAPISLSDDIVFVRPIVCGGGSASASASARVAASRACASRKKLRSRFSGGLTRGLAGGEEVA